MRFDVNPHGAIVETVLIRESPFSVFHEVAKPFQAIGSAV